MEEKGFLLLLLQGPQKTRPYPMTKEKILPPSPQSLMDNFISLCRSRPQKVFCKLIFPARKDIEITYQDLYDNSCRYANFYEENGVGKNQVIVLMLQHSAELIYSFVGAMLYGAIPSLFSFPSMKTSQEEYRRTLPVLLEVCATRFLMASGDISLELKRNPLILDDVVLLDANGYRDHHARFDPLPTYNGNDIVLLQHSSGTTGLKKGVALSSSSVISQVKNYAAALHLSESDKIISWLPLYHDMGLIACFILPLMCCVPVVLISPFDWVRDPGLLLRTISKEKGTLCWQPNFAYNFLASKIIDTEKLDLSTMRAFVNCSEPISAACHDAFYERFKGCGLRKEALCTSYAMAENTFAVTQAGVSSPVLVEEIDLNIFTTKRVSQIAARQSKSRRRVVSSGRPIPNNQLRIVDDGGRILPDRHIGEILIKSDSMLDGYYRRPDLTREAIKDGWYYSGDLGYLADGELFVTGRKKDMIIVAGKNIYPQDIEEIVSSIKGVYPGRTVAFGIYNESLGTEDVVIIAETDAKDKAEQLSIKLSTAQAVREGLECVANEIVLVPHMWLIKSSSGKIARSANRDKFFKEIKKYEH